MSTKTLTNKYSLRVSPLDAAFPTNPGDGTVMVNHPTQAKSVMARGGFDSAARIEAVFGPTPPGGPPILAVSSMPINLTTFAKNRVVPRLASQASTDSWLLSSLYALAVRIVVFSGGVEVLNLASTFPSLTFTHSSMPTDASNKQLGQLEILFPGLRAILPGNFTSFLARPTYHSDMASFYFRGWLHVFEMVQAEEGIHGCDPAVIGLRADIVMRNGQVIPRNGVSVATAPVQFSRLLSAMSGAQTGTHFIIDKEGISKDEIAMAQICLGQWNSIHTTVSDSDGHVYEPTSNLLTGAGCGLELVIVSTASHIRLNSNVLPALAAGSIPGSASSNSALRAISEARGEENDYLRGLQMAVAHAGCCLELVTVNGVHSMRVSRGHGGLRGIAVPTIIDTKGMRQITTIGRNRGKTENPGFGTLLSTAVEGMCHFSIIMGCSLLYARSVAAESIGLTNAALDHGYTNGVLAGGIDATLSNAVKQAVCELAVNHVSHLDARTLTLSSDYLGYDSAKVIATHFAICGSFAAHDHLPGYSLGRAGNVLTYSRGWLAVAGYARAYPQNCPAVFAGDIIDIKSCSQYVVTDGVPKRQFHLHLHRQVFQATRTLQHSTNTGTVALLVAQQPHNAVVNRFSRPVGTGIGLTAWVNDGVVAIPTHPTTGFAVEGSFPPFDWENNRSLAYMVTWISSLVDIDIGDFENGLLSKYMVEPTTRASAFPSTLMGGMTVIPRMSNGVFSTPGLDESPSIKVLSATDAADTTSMMLERIKQMEKTINRLRTNVAKKSQYEDPADSSGRPAKRAKVASGIVAEEMPAIKAAADAAAAANAVGTGKLTASGFEITEQVKLADGVKNGVATLALEGAETTHQADVSKSALHALMSEGETK